MFAGLLESDVNKMWSFQTFYETAQSIVRKTVLDVFYVVTSQLLKVYINPTYSLVLVLFHSLRFKFLICKIFSKETVSELSD